MYPSPAASLGIRNVLNAVGFPLVWDGVVWHSTCISSTLEVDGCQAHKAVYLRAAHPAWPRSLSWEGIFNRNTHRGLTFAVFPWFNFHGFAVFQPTPFSQSLVVTLSSSQLLGDTAFPPRLRFQWAALSVCSHGCLEWIPFGGRDGLEVLGTHVRL